ncbi:MAG: recombination regulator RecX [Lachnospiraceae bacterium]|nr:recombination regulator RecX [Lachnospiraceae bacterium]
MTVTDIKPAKKALSMLYIDGEYAMKLDTATLKENCVKVGTVLDDGELKELIEKSDYRRAKEKALWLISGKDYSKKQLADKLRKESSEETAQEVCERMEELGLVNDENYARRYAHDLLYLKKMSKRGAKYKLMEKGIDRDLCEEILDDFEVDPVDQLVELIDRKYADKLDDEKGRRRTIAALQRLGYGWGDIKSALRAFEEEY